MDVLIERLRQISETFLDNAPFTAYLTTKDNKTHYGLDYDELELLYGQHEGKIKVINASASTPSGKGVSINLRFLPKSTLAYGQFVIASGNASVNEQIEEMIYGIWEPRPEPEYEPIPLQNLLQGIINHHEKQQPAAPPRPPQPPPQVITLRESFYFDKRVSVHRILDLLNEISLIFLDGAPFNIRLATTQADYFEDLRSEELIDFFSRYKRRVLTLYADAGTRDGYLVDIKLMYRPRNAPPTAEIEITAPDGDEIAELISDVLAIEEIPLPQKIALHTETFRFDDQTFSIEHFCNLMQIISTTYLHRAEPVAVLSTSENESYSRLSLFQLQEAYQRHASQVHVISVVIQHAATQQSFNIMLQFRNGWRESGGALTLMLGDQVLHREVRTLIWDRLQLLPPPIDAPDSPAADKEEVMQVNPVFKSRNFKRREGTCLVCMPLEAYWSDTLWEHLKSTLRMLNYECIRSNSIYYDQQLEAEWKLLNEVDMVIADMTYKNPDVFYKTGVAHTLGKKVLILTQHERDIPKDFKNFPHLIYNNDLPGLFRMAEDLKQIIKN
ncbi:MAG: hypothetical protein D6730_20210 [Bacteroidetes bacterium]|nr:MAG: hypothetical protein D6730_20210 [Bacteroidota bacterium]